MRNFLLLFLLLGCGPHIFAEENSGGFKNLPQIQRKLNFLSHYNKSVARPLKIAILDKGFRDFTTSIVRNHVVRAPEKMGTEDVTEHGTRMAEILWSLLTNHGSADHYEPKLYLLNVYGYSNFKAAVDTVIREKIDLVLYSEVWEYGGNNDGGGFLNAQVSRAIESGALWVNAAGNFGQTTFNSGVRTLEESWVKLPNTNNALELRCEKNKEGTCFVRAVLAWNDFKDEVDSGTDKDLDFALMDDMMNVVQSSALKQSPDSKEERPGYSKYPREIITAEVPVGRYYLKVKNRSHNFSSDDRLRISVDGNFVTMSTHDQKESLLNPADHPEAITVGASDSNRSSKSIRAGKPELVAPSSLIFGDDEVEYRGSSNSAAIVAAGLAILKSQNPDWERAELLRKVRRGQSWNQTGLSLALLGFGYTGPGCFLEASFPHLPAHVTNVLARGGVLTQTTAGARIMTPFDPIGLDSKLRRNFMNDMILATPTGFQIVPRNQSVGIPSDWVEVFQRPLEAGLCRTPNVSKNAFYLP